jgi:transposase
VFEKPASGTDREVRARQRKALRGATGTAGQGVQSAPLPARIIDKGLASDRVVIDTVVSKYADHVPLYRQRAILKRETGIELSRAMGVNGPGGYR